MILKAHTNQEGKRIVAIIDDDLLGRIVENDDLVLDFSARFYQGTRLDPESILAELEGAYMLNCAGDETISFLKEHGIVAQDDVTILDGVPYVYILVSS